MNSMDLLVNIDVPDLAAAVAFYTAAFGLTVTRRLGPEAAELVGGPVPIYLLQKPAGCRRRRSPSPLRPALDPGPSRFGGRRSRDGARAGAHSRRARRDGDPHRGLGPASSSWPTRSATGSV